MRLSSKVLVYALSVCPAAGLTEVASGAGRPGGTASPAAAIATPSSAWGEAGGLKTQDVVIYNTVAVTNLTGTKVTLFDFRISGGYSYESAIRHNAGLWLPKPGDTLDDGQTEAYGVVAYFVFPEHQPMVSVAFKDEHGNVGQYATRSYLDGSSTVTQWYRDGLTVRSTPAGPGAYTEIILEPKA
ncbi:hypothetical protein [Streptomyces sp. NPDC001774]